MPWIKFGNTIAHVRVSRPRRKPCAYCDREHEFLCDFPMGSEETCDKRLCPEHRLKGVTPGIDFCPEHFEMAKAAYLRRMAKKRDRKNSNG